MKLYAAPRTRAVRIAWLLKELNQPYEIEHVEFVPTVDKFFIQNTPTGKIPTLEDGDVLLCESGAILEYILSMRATTDLVPPNDSPDFARYLQWVHFSESTAWAPIGVMVWLTVYRKDAENHPELIQDARARVNNTLEFINNSLDREPYLLGKTFSAADIMLGFTLIAAQTLGLLTDDHAKIKHYVHTLQARPAFQAAAQEVGGFD